MRWNWKDREKQFPKCRGLCFLSNSLIHPLFSTYYIPFWSERRFDAKPSVSWMELFQISLNFEPLKILNTITFFFDFLFLIPTHPYPLVVCSALGLVGPLLSRSTPFFLRSILYFLTYTTWNLKFSVFDNFNVYYCLLYLLIILKLFWIN